MGKRLGRTAAIVLSAIAVVAAGLNPAAAEPDTVAAAQKELAAIQEQAAKADAAYADAEDAYGAASKKLTQTDAEIVTQSAVVTKLKGNLAQYAIQQFQGGGFDVATRLMVATDETLALNSIATLNTVTEATTGNVQDVQVEQAKLDRLRADAADLTARMQAEKDKQGALVKQLDDQEKASQAVLNRLKSEERARLLAAQQQQTTTAQNNASQAVASPGFGDGGSGSERGRAAVQYAIAQLGKPYIFASSGPNGFDCSGLTSAAYASVGISLPHQSRSQFGVGVPVAKSDLQPGDLLFFYGGITHVGMYVGNGVMIHSAPSGRGVHYSNLATYPSYQGARRVA